MLSVIIIAKDEQSRIKICLESVKWADEIIFIDSGSTDSTVEIAKKYTDKVFKITFEDFAKQRNEAFKKSKGDWVLYIDADERVLEELKQEIISIMHDDKAKSAYAISRINVFFGHRVSYGPYKKDWVVRLFKREAFEEWVGKVHEYPKFKGDLGYTRNALLHLTHRDLDHFMKKALEWSVIDAKLKLEAKHPLMNKWRFLRIFTTEAFNQLITRKGLFGGTVGIIDSMLQVFSMYFTYVRLWEYQQPKPLDEVYTDIDKKLIENNFKYP